MFALGRASEIADKLKKQFPNIFIGICGYKIENKHVTNLKKQSFFDAIIAGNVENAFMNIDPSPFFGPPEGRVYGEQITTPNLQIKIFNQLINGKNPRATI